MNRVITVIIMLLLAAPALNGLLLSGALSSDDSKSYQGPEAASTFS